MDREYNLKQFVGGKYDWFSRGSFRIFTFLILFSPAFTSMYKENVLLYFVFVGLITMNNLCVEYFSIAKKGNEPKEYTGLFMLISLPINIILLLIFYIL
ncbi:hypothetical protein [Mesobacillus maritimus]|uniref:DUF4181 domain-containing protein n=1 Tax=Mesobacillus maritimus TaxID=1643336 RepID=A0ABS7K6X4_9BACI|nr:hypothetical protein [Mesobacillus maritimus]MBY0097975.1 hypothetical protein [Mesobacillus maritimus]